MKTAGIIGGMSWEFTIPYYHRINTGILSIPFLHIAGVTASRILADNMARVGLLGMAFTTGRIHAEAAAEMTAGAEGCCE